MNKALLKFHEYPVSESQLAKLSQDQRAAFYILCFAVTEINSISRLLFVSSTPVTGYPEIDAGIACQHFCQLRILSSKVFEVVEFLKFRGKHNKTNDKSLENFGRSALRKIEKLKGYDFAKKLRNEATSHYQLKPARRRLESVHDEHIRSMYMHELVGNCF